MTEPRDSSKITEAIDWHEGMLLAPQHFQQLALRQEELLHYHAAALAPFHWGVLRRDIDTAALTEGLLRVGGLEAVLPDGLVVSRSLRRARRNRSSNGRRFPTASRSPPGPQRARSWAFVTRSARSRR